MGQGYLELPQGSYHMTCHHYAILCEHVTITRPLCNHHTVECPNGNLTKTLLKSKEVYIFDCHSDIFVWYEPYLPPSFSFSTSSTFLILISHHRIGQHSARLVRAAALKLADELLEMMKRPASVAMVTRVLEG